MKIVSGAAVISSFLTLTAPTLSHSHDGELDRYGCHPDKERGSYHCHDGMLKGGNFDSQEDMVRQLKRQLETLGRPWPYGDLIEEDITSPDPRLKKQP